MSRSRPLEVLTRAALADLERPVRDLRRAGWDASVEVRSVEDGRATVVVVVALPAVLVPVEALET